MVAMIYLASPYSHPSKNVREHRYLMARGFTLWALRNSLAIFSPIVYGKDMEQQIGMNFEAWQILNDSMVKVCPQFWVLTLDGWEESKGVAHEIELARSLGRSIVYAEPREVHR